MKKTLSFILSFILILSLAGCKDTSAETKYTDYSFDYFDTVTTIVGFEQSKEEFDAKCLQLKARLEEYHKLYTFYLRYEGVNNLCRINETVDGAHQTLTVDRKIIDLLLYAKEIYSLTDGKTNVAMGSVLSIWHQYREEGTNDPAEAKLPPMDALREAAEHTNINDILIDEQNCTVFLSDPAMRLDVGAVAKGYAVEKIALWMRENGMEDYTLNVGGNVCAVGPRPDGQKWRIGIENPDTENIDRPYIEYLEFVQMSLVTSGSYQRFYTVDGKNYHHIIDPDTLMPSEYFLSVSVLCKDSGLADALSTALFSMSYEEGSALVASNSDVEAMWVLPTGVQRYSSGFQAYCTEK